jgi:hypothetical protein
VVMLESYEDIEKFYKVDKITDDNFTRIKGDNRTVSLGERNAIKVWNTCLTIEEYCQWLEESYDHVGYGRQCYVYGKDNYVVKIAHTGTFDNYFNRTRVPHVIGCSSNKTLNDSYLKIREVFLSHILYPTLFSKDIRCCTQPRLKQGGKYHQEIKNYFSEQLKNVSLPFTESGDVRLLGPFENLAWSEKENKAYIIDIY